MNYNFEEELESLRFTISREPSLDSSIRFQKPTHKQCLPLIITISNYLTARGVPVAQQKQHRIRMYQEIIPDVQSTYDFTVYQIRSILQWIAPDRPSREGQEISRRFLADLAIRAKESSNPGKRVFRATATVAS